MAERGSPADHSKKKGIMSRGWEDRSKICEKCSSWGTDWGKYLKLLIWGLMGKTRNSAHTFPNLPHWFLCCCSMWSISINFTFLFSLTSLWVVHNWRTLNSTEVPTRSSCYMLQSQNVTGGLTPFCSLDFDSHTISEIALGKAWELSTFVILLL